MLSRHSQFQIPVAASPRRDAITGSTETGDLSTGAAIRYQRHSGYGLRCRFGCWVGWPARRAGVRGSNRVPNSGIRRLPAQALRGLFEFLRTRVNQSALIGLLPPRPAPARLHPSGLPHTPALPGLCYRPVLPACAASLCCRPVLPACAASLCACALLGSACAHAACASRPVQPACAAGLCACALPGSACAHAACAPRTAPTSALPGLRYPAGH
jgi:hypothetical protein